MTQGVDDGLAESHAKEVGAVGIQAAQAGQANGQRLDALAGGLAVGPGADLEPPPVLPLDWARPPARRLWTMSPPLPCEGSDGPHRPGVPRNLAGRVRDHLFWSRSSKAVAGRAARVGTTRSATRAEKCEERTPTDLIPARRAPSRPAGASSTTTHRRGGTSTPAAPGRKIEIGRAHR